MLADGTYANLSANSARPKRHKCVPNVVANWYGYAASVAAGMDAARVCSMHENAQACTRRGILTCVMSEVMLS